MLLTVWMYAYLRGVLSTRAVEDRCRYDATFRVACGREVPDHTTFSRFRKYLFAREGLAGELFCQVLRVCACAGPGRLSVVAGDGVKIAASASKEAGRTEAGLRKLAAQVIAGARKAAADEGAERDVAPGTDLPLGAESAPGPDPRSRAGRARACPDDLRGEREAAEAQAREQGKASLQALAAGAVSGRPPAAVILAAARPRLEEAVAAEEAVLAGWQARKAAGQRVTRPPARPGTGKKARRARARLEALQAAAAAEAARAGDSGNRRKEPQRNVTDPDSRLLPARGGGFIQGCNCQERPRPTTGSCSAAAPARTPATRCRRSGSRRRQGKAPRPATPPTPATPPRSRDATPGCAPCRRRAGAAPATTPPPAMPP